jgi:hypothetical protein
MVWQAVAFLFGLSAAGFAAGYLTRAAMSRRRRIARRDD